MPIELFFVSKYVEIYLLTQWSTLFESLCIISNTLILNVCSKCTGLALCALLYSSRSNMIESTIGVAMMMDLVLKGHLGRDYF